MEKNDRNEYHVTGALTFKDSRLMWASLTWDGDDAGAAKLARSLYFLLNSFEKQGNTSCTIETTERESPERFTAENEPLHYIPSHIRSSGP